MPRRKVRDEDRQRAPTACIPCKKSKIRCDAQLPCATCVRKDRVASCNYVDDNNYGPTGFRQKFQNTLPVYIPSTSSPLTKRQRLSSSVDADSNTNTNMNTKSTTPTSTILTVQEGSALSVPPELRGEEEEEEEEGQEGEDEGQFIDQQRQLRQGILATTHELHGSLDGHGGFTTALSTLDSRDEHQENNAMESLNYGSDFRPDTVKSPEVTQSRLIFNNKGEKVFIGEIASISFLAFLRRTLRYHMGTSAFTEADSRNVMLEIESTTHVSSVPDTLTQEDCKVMLECFSKVTSGILQLFTQQELNHHSLTHINISNNDQTIILLALSIGAQCRGHSQDLQYATRIFSNAQTSAFEDMLRNPGIEMIKTFLLMSFYMLGACRRNAAFMYLGVAAKAACALGLHSRDYSQNLTVSRKHAMESVWKSLLILDTVVSAVLGRPSSLPEYISDDFELPQPSLEPADLALNACYGICARLRWFIQNIPGRQNGCITMTESFLETLRKWSQNLHPDLRQFSGSSANAERLIGNMHIGCIYYFTVMLATRPFFISRMLAVVQKPPHTTPTVSTDHEKVVALAEACLDAAIHLSQLCHTVFNQGVCQSNMCLIKAFVFAAGLLLGFHLFAAESNDDEVQVAFDNVLSILYRLSYLSPQAKHYQRILGDFANAIERYHQQKLDKKKRATSQYLDHIFDMSGPHSRVTTTASRYHFPSPVSGKSGSTQTEPQIVQDPMISTAGDLFPDFDFEAMMEMYDPGNLPLIWDDFRTD